MGFQLSGVNMMEVKELPETPGLALQVREEQMRLRPDLNATITGDVLNEMTYSRQVVKEVLRYRPPAPMVPQVRENHTQLTDRPDDSGPSVQQHALWASTIVHSATVEGKHALKASIGDSDAVECGPLLSSAYHQLAADLKVLCVWFCADHPEGVPADRRLHCT